MFKVIDISKHNGNINFEQVKADGITGVIIRAGYGRLISQKDKPFDSYYAAAKAAGLQVGSYWYSYAASVSEVITEADVFVEAIKGKQFELPVYFDIEEQKHLALGKDICSRMIDTFCGYLENAGYFAGIYSFDSFFGSNISDAVQKKYTCWVARVDGVKPKYCKSYDLWQYTWEAAVKGLQNPCDCSECYKDFASVIKKAKLNGFKGGEYTVSAHISGVTAEKAAAIAAACRNHGMTVVSGKE